MSERICKDNVASTGLPCPYTAKPGSDYCGFHGKGKGKGRADEPTTADTSLSTQGTASLSGASDVDAQIPEPAIAPEQLERREQPKIMSGDTHSYQPPSNYLRSLGKMSARQRTIVCVEAVLNSGYNAMLWGSPGIGKTTTLESMAEEAGYKFEVVDLSNVDEVSELVGYVNAVETDFGFEAQKIPPSWLARLHRDRLLEESGVAPRPTLVLFDEYGGGEPSAQKASMNILNHKRAGDIKLPSNVRMVLASNRPEDSTHAAAGISEASQDRMAHFDIAPNTLADWEQGWLFGYKNTFLGHPPRDMVAKAELKWKATIIQFVKQHSQDFWGDKSEKYFQARSEGGGYATERAYFRLARALAEVEHIPDADPVRQELMEGIIGKDAGRALMSYAEDMNLPDPEEWLNDPDAARTLTDDKGKPVNDKTAATINMVIVAALEEPPPGSNVGKAWKGKRKLAALECMVNLRKTAPPNSSTASYTSGAVMRLMEDPHDIPLNNATGTRVLTGLTENFKEHMQALKRMRHQAMQAKGS